jgi:hypothetical protein
MNTKEKGDIAVGRAIGFFITKGMKCVCQLVTKRL